MSAKVAVVGGGEQLWTEAGVAALSGFSEGQYAARVYFWGWEDHWGNHGICCCSIGSCSPDNVKRRNAYSIRDREIKEIGDNKAVTPGKKTRKISTGDAK